MFDYDRIVKLLMNDEINVSKRLILHNKERK